MKLQDIRAQYLGKTWNLFTCVEYVSRQKGYLFRCECGEYRTYHVYRIRKGEIKSCGKCYKPGRAVLPDNIGAKRAVLSQYKQSAKRRKIPYSLEESYAISLITQNCAYCDSAPSYDIKMSAHPEFRYNGIDRVVNDVGYTENNTVTCCFTCNSAKRVQSKADWFLWVKRVYEHNHLEKLNG